MQIRSRIQKGFNSGAQWGLFDEKPKGRKSRDTLLLKMVCFNQQRPPMGFTLKLMPTQL
jgi:hypothetical protein